MVDEIRVLRLLRGLADNLGVLRSEATAEAGRRSDPIWLRGVAQHICSAQGWGPPADNGDALHGVLAAELADFGQPVTAFVQRG